MQRQQSLPTANQQKTKNLEQLTPSNKGEEVINESLNLDDSQEFDIADVKMVEDDFASPIEEPRGAP